MFHIYFCENTKRPEAIVFHRRHQFEVEWRQIGALTEEFLGIDPANDQSFADFRARWKADDVEVMLKVRDQKGGFIPSGLLSMSGIDDTDLKSVRQRLEADVWLLVDADRSPTTDEVRSELLRWLRGDYAVPGLRNRTVEAFTTYVKGFRGPQREAELELVRQFVQRLTPIKNLEPLKRLQSYLSLPFYPVPPHRDLEWDLAERMQKQLETDSDALRELLDIPRSRIPLWGYPGGSLISPCLVELAYCIEHNIKFRKCHFPECTTWFALADSGNARDCHKHRALDSTIRWRARKRAEDLREFKLKWAWRRSNERRAQRGHSHISLAEYRRVYKPKGKDGKESSHNAGDD